MNLLRELKLLPEFQDVWDTVEKPDFSPQFPVPTRFSLRTGEDLDFIIMSNYDVPLLVSNLSRVLYIPFDDRTKEQFAKTMANVPRLYARIDLAHPRQFSINNL